MASDQARELRRQGIAAAKAGQKDEARKLLQQSLRLDPRSEAAWLWLATVARDQRERFLCLYRLLEINPENEMGLQSLQQLGMTREQLTEQVESMVTPIAAPAQPAPPPPGVPIADAQRLTQLQAEIDAAVREYLAPAESIPGVKWTQKSGGRAGERDATTLAVMIGAGVLVALVLIVGIGALVVWNTPSLRGVVFAPTDTPTRTPAPPTATFTPTPGNTPTPSPTPQVTFTPSPTVPTTIPNGQLNPPGPTPIYPPVLEKGVRDAISLLDRGDFGAAVPTLIVEVTRVANSFDPNPYYYAALGLAARGDLGLARSLLTDAEQRLSERPGERTSVALINAGIAYVDLLTAERSLRENDVDRANTLLADVEDRANLALQDDPRLELPYLTLARRYSLDKRYDRALGTIESALALPELSASTRLITERGEIYFQQGEYDRAAYQAFLALYIDPAVEAAHQLRIRSSLALNRPGQAVLQAQEYLYYYPGSVEGYKLLGDARVAEGNTDLALAAYSRALTAGDVARVLLARAGVYTTEGRLEQARDDLSKALALSDDPTVRARRMMVAYQTGNYSTAQSDINELLGRNVLPDSELRLLQARILLDQGGFENTSRATDALAILDSIQKDLPRSLIPIESEYRARAQYTLQNYADALKSVETALVAGETGSRRYLRGLILEAQGKDEAALREYDWVRSLAELYPYSFLPDVNQRITRLEQRAS